MNATYELTLQWKSPDGIAVHLVRGIPLAIDPADVLREVSRTYGSRRYMPANAAFEFAVTHRNPLTIELKPLT